MGRDGFEAFVVAYGTDLTRLALLITGDRGRAEDATQTAFEKVFVRWGHLDDPLRYARRVAVNAARDTWRRHGRREVLGYATAETGSAYPDEARRLVVLQALAQLPRQQRAVVVLRHWLDLSEAETAATLGVSNGTVKSHNSRGLAALRASLLDLDCTSNQAKKGN